jgi:carbonic anhydrase
MITQCDPGDLFVIRNAGNLVPTIEAAPGSGEVATIEFAVSALKVKDIIICGHTKCGAMHAVLYQRDTDQLPQLRRWLCHAETTRQIMLTRYEHLNLDSEAMWKATVEENVLVQLNNLRSHPAVAAALERGQLKLHAWVYKIETGQVFAYDPEAGQYRELDRTLAEAAIPAMPSCHEHLDSTPSYGIVTGV